MENKKIINDKKLMPRKIKARKMKKLMLISPPITYNPQGFKYASVPLGIAYLAAFMRNEIEVAVLDAPIEGYYNEEHTGSFVRFGLSMAEIEKKIYQFQPDIVGVSCFSSNQSANNLEVCKAVKRVSSDIITISGGSHPTVQTERCLSAPALDLVARGEGEYILRDTIEAISKGKSLSRIDGLAYKDSGKIKINKDRAPCENLDEIPFPARDMFDLNKYYKIGKPLGNISSRKPFMNIITSRGCPYKCVFCCSTNLWKNHFRGRSPENVLSEMEYLYNELGVRVFNFFDDNLTYDKDRFKKILRGMIERKFNVSWDTPNGVHCASIDNEMLDLMKAGGCKELTISVESGDPDVLAKIIHKPTKLYQIEKAVREIKRRKIRTHGIYIIGFPGETKKQIMNSMQFSKKIDLDWISIFIANPLPGTELFNICRDKGYINDQHVSDNDDYFVRNFDTPDFTKEELYKLRSRWFWTYHIIGLLRHPIIRTVVYISLFLKPGVISSLYNRIIPSVFKK